MRNIRAAVVAILAISVSPAFANYSCSGAVQGITISPDGQVFASSIGSLSYPRICSVTATSNGVSTEACKVIYSALLTAQTTGKTVSFTFNDAGDCNSHTAWGWLTGWYFGPVIN